MPLTAQVMQPGKAALHAMQDLLSDARNSPLVHALHVDPSVEQLLQFAITELHVLHLLLCRTYVFAIHAEQLEIPVVLVVLHVLQPGIRLEQLMHVARPVSGTNEFKHDAH